MTETTGLNHSTELRSVNFSVRQTAGSEINSVGLRWAPNFTLSTVQSILLAALACLLSLAQSAEAQLELFIPLGATWKYLDDGSNQGTAWKEKVFNDTAWASGPAELGYGDGGEATVVGFGGNSSNKFTTTYFRHTFNVADPGTVVGLALDLVRDDGAVVYLNGTEIFRSNMPSGTITSSTFASSGVGGGSESALFSTTVSTSLLETGDNVVAVEIHQINLTSSDISFNLKLEEVVPPVPGLSRGPYLQLGGTDRMTVRWRTDNPTDTVLRYGLVEGTLNQVINNAALVTEHVVPITGLTTDTKYYYSIGDSTTTFASGAEYYFETHPALGSTGPSRIWILGDSGTADASATAVRNAFVSVNGSSHTDLLLMLGDNAYNSGTDAEYQAAVFEMYPDTIRNTVTWPTLGNHDAGSADSPTQSGVYYDIFTLPTAAEAGGVASGTEAYYSFDYANIHFVCLDSHDTSRLAGGAMATWLTNDLSATTQEFIIAFWHHPPYSKGSHNSDTEGRMIDMRQVFVPILETYGVDLVFGGHSHDYERSMLINGHYGLSGTFDTMTMARDTGDGDPAGDGAYLKTASPNQGAVYTVAGSSGKISSAALNHPIMLRNLLVLGSVIIDVDGLIMNVRFVDSTGTERDAFTLQHVPPGPNQAPTLVNNALAVTEGVPVTLTSANLSATDPDDAAASLAFTLTEVTAGEFQVSGASATAFTQSQISAGAVKFVHDGGFIPPSYSVTVSDGEASDGPEAAAITFQVIDDTPVITANSMMLDDGDAVELRADRLSATDDESPAANLSFTVSSVSGGEFKVNSVASTTFTQAEISAGLVEFQHDGLGSAPAYSVSVSDGVMTTGPQAAVVRFGTGVSEFVRLGANWKYLDDGSNQGTAWRGKGFFDDGAWSAGPAELGYGDGGEATVVSFGGNSSNKFTTTYFRNTFSIADPAAFEDLDLGLIRDDGVLVYLNDTEVFRSNMPAGNITSSTFASSSISGSGETTLQTTTVNSSLLVAGTNVLAVEIHQTDLTSSDISFDLKLEAQPVPIAVALNAPADGAQNQDLSVTLEVTVTDREGDALDVTFFGRAPPAAFAAIQTNIAVASGSSTTATWSGLAVDTDYEWYATVTDGSPTTSPTWIFSTRPLALTLAASPVLSTSATLNGTADPQGLPTNTWFEWGTSAAYGNTTPAQAVADTGSPQAASATINGLTPGQTYHFRLVVQNSAGTSFGDDLTFTASSGAQSAGALYVDLKATDPTAGSLSWTNPGTLGDAFTAAGSPALTPNVAGTGVPGVGFDSLTDAFVGPTTVADIHAASDRTLETWVYNPAGESSSETMVNLGRQGTDGRLLALGIGSSHAVDHQGAAYDLFWNAALPAYGAWHHIVYIYDGSTSVTVYVDGQLAVAATIPAALDTWPDAIALGASRDASQNLAWGSHGFSGYLNTVRIHGNQLTPAQVLENYNLGPAGATADGDAWSPAFEVLFGFDGTAFNGTSPIAFGTTTVGNQVFVTYSFTRRSDLSGLASGLVVSFSSEYNNGFASVAASSSVDIGGGFQTDTYTDPSPINDNGTLTQRFGKIAVAGEESETFATVPVTIAGDQDELATTSSFTRFAAGVVGIKVAVGTATAVGTSTLTDSGANFGTLTPNRYYVILTSGDDAGARADIAANTAVQLTLSSNFSPLDVVGESYEIRQHLTIGSLLGAANEAGLLAAGNSADADNLLLTRGAVETFFYSNVPGQEGWKDSGADDATDEHIDPAVPLTVRRKVTGDRTIYPTGAIRHNGTAVTIADNANTFIALPNSVAITFSSLGLDSVVNRGLNPNDADNLLIFNANGSVTRCFYLELGGTEGWYDSSYTPADPIPPASAIIFQRKGGGPLNWVIPGATP